MSRGKNVFFRGWPLQERPTPPVPRRLASTHAHVVCFLKVGAEDAHFSIRACCRKPGRNNTWPRRLADGKSNHVAGLRGQRRLRRKPARGCSERRPSDRRMSSSRATLSHCVSHPVFQWVAVSFLIPSEFSPTKCHIQLVLPFTDRECLFSCCFREPWTLRFADC